MIHHLFFHLLDQTNEWDAQQSDKTNKQTNKKSNKTRNKRETDRIG